MGLTVHYRFSFEGSEEELLDKLNWLSVEFLKLPVLKVHPLIKGRRGYELPVEVANGCEWFVIILKEEAEGSWNGRSFTKTEYAQDRQACHNIVLSLLDLCKQSGILLEVNDEAERMKTTIWDLEKGEKFTSVDGILCEVVTPTQDGKGLVAKYLNGHSAGEEDFIFENDIDFEALP